MHVAKGANSYCDVDDIFELLIIHYQEFKFDDSSTPKAKGAERSEITEPQPNQIIVTFSKLVEGIGLKNTNSKE